MEAILQTVHRSPLSRILVCAPSNSAVDLIASLLHSSLKENIAIIDKAKKSVGDIMFRLNGFLRPPKTLDPQSLMEISLCIFYYYKKYFGLISIDNCKIKKEALIFLKLKNCWNSTLFCLLAYLQVPYINIIFLSALVINSLLGYLYSIGVTPKHFTHIFVDEAGEALEPETLIPIQLSNENTSIVLAGDHLQLGPIVR